MQLGSDEHKKLLMKGIIRTSTRVIKIGVFVGLLLMIPLILRDNTFSTGLFYMGAIIALGSLLYGILLGYIKYKKIIVPFDNEHS
jgi:hypothetical protein